MTGGFEIATAIAVTLAAYNLLKFIGEKRRTGKLTGDDLDTVVAGAKSAIATLNSVTEKFDIEKALGEKRAAAIAELKGKINDLKEPPTDTDTTS